VNVALPKRPKSKFKLAQQSMQHALRANYSNIYNVKTGGTADDFFSEKKREHLLNIIKFESDDEKDKMRLFLQHCNVVIRTMSTKSHINNLEEFNEYALEGNALMCELFRWKLCAASSHMTFGHVYHAIKKNGHHG
jgi:UDP-N-acetylenolpyruvoylglucosamine reductase